MSAHPVPHAPAAPVCLAPLPAVPPTAVTVPPGAWDCHAHVLGPADLYPMQAERSYTPPDSSAAQYAALLETLGLRRGVLVQPSVYGTDNRLLAQAVARPEWRGVAVLDPAADTRQVAALHAAGVRGFRLNLLFPGGPGLDALERSAALVAPFGWHAQLLVDVRILPGIEHRLARLPVPVVFDHLGHFPYELGTDWPGFHALLRRVAAGRTYVKLSGSYRLSARASHIADVAPIAQALVREAPQRLVWGSDWPHVGRFQDMPATHALLDALALWCPDPAAQRAILVDTPTQLYS
ncbi:amidohydrolase family protein [Bordetella bronchiseptica]|uniref:amidohydrolase family protein n=1 Tax=Bordetella bronchiseptica TaxID=518 RepID=UPI00045AFEDC|nr:amidohydrolase family protein [Bordetella bronchiseptica]AUL17688.1 hydrolase [Bordetella bronchiseptica]AWP60927.1 hydrolase [Bordetella bronchiseptica]KAK54925.1 putative 4-sulfomuconolactone hydrolase [Bordetella bronchiseptica OSU054]KAK73997.1 putative 4-sulfomuconolactone hydrolase [Bordetella bronchiseptica CA90 BB02]KCV58618.1 putative 4-sulfomuconolactone hydrolase [Bordetella bronchiseptica 7E71]